MSAFRCFVGKYVKAPYIDGAQYKIARGKLVEAGDGFVTIVGPLGTIIINEKNIEKMAEAKHEVGGLEE